MSSITIQRFVLLLLICSCLLPSLVQSFAPFKWNKLKKQQSGPTALDLSAYINKTVLVIAAHPDDIETCAGGTVALLTAQASRVHYIITTNGDKGYSKDRNMTSERLAVIRFNEQMNAAANLSVTSVHMLDYEDGLLDMIPESDIRLRLVALIRQIRPDLVLTWSPYYSFNLFQFGLEHADHRTTGLRVIDAVYPAARDYLAFPQLLEQGLQPHVVPLVLLFGFNEFDYYVDISSVLKQKVSALSCHVSQYSDINVLTESVVQQAEYVASVAMKSELLYAEGFVAVKQL